MRAPVSPHASTTAARKMRTGTSHGSAFRRQPDSGGAGVALATTLGSPHRATMSDRFLVAIGSVKASSTIATKGITTNGMFGTYPAIGHCWRK